MPSRASLFFAFILALGFIAPAHARYIREVEETFTVSSGGQLTINTSGGEVTVETGARDAVQVLARQVFHSADNAREADDVAKDLEFSITQDGNEISAHSKFKQGPLGWFSWGKQGVTVSFVVKVPAHFNVKVSTSGGDIEVADVIGRVEVRTSGGDIDLGRIEGPVEAVTSGGDITVEAGRGKMSVVTSGGDIRVARADGDVQAATSGGNVHIAYVAGVLNASSSGGNVFARFGKELSGDASLSTSGGNVTAWLPDGTGVYLDASTSGGAVKTDGISVRVEKGGEGKTKLVGDVNGGGKRLKLRTSGGDIQVKSDS